jgi:hypothetical protein
MTGRLSLLAVLIAAVSASGQVREFTEPIVIPRLSPTVAVPPPFQATQASRPAAVLAGSDKFGTVFRFAPTITGQLIKTEGFGSGKVGGSWNNGNTDGDTSLKAVLCPSAHDFSVDGQAQLGNHPHGTTGEHGVDSPRRADGLCSQGAGFIGEHLRFFQIPGTAIVLKSGGGTQSGAMGIYDWETTRLDDISILNCVAGIDCDVGDARLSRISIAGVAKDGIVVGGPGTYMDDCHVWGATRAAVIKAETIASNCYFEAARIGTHILPTAPNTDINGLNIGPATCWERGVLIESDDVVINRLTGAVAVGAVGVEIHPYRANVKVSGRLGFQGKSTGILLAGHNNQVDLIGSTNTEGATFVKLVKNDALAATQLDVRIRGYLGAGVALDLSESGLDKANGQGNQFDVKCNGLGTPIIYPGGGKKYNLAPGNLVWLNGVLQK